MPCTVLNSLAIIDDKRKDFGSFDKISIKRQPKSFFFAE